VKALSISRCCKTLLLGLLILLAPAFTLAQQDGVDLATSELMINRQQLLENETNATANDEAELAASRHQLQERIAELASRPVDQTELEQAGLALDTAKVTQESVELTIKLSQQWRKDIAADIQRLEEQLQLLAAAREGIDKPRVQKHQAMLNEKQALLKLSERRQELLERRRQLAKERTQLAERRLETIKEAYRNQQEQARKLSLEDQEKQLIGEMQGWQEKAVEQRAALNRLREDPAVSASVRDVAEAQLVQAEESLFLVGIDLRYVRMQSQLDKFGAVAKDEISDIRELKSFSSQLKNMKSQLESIQVLVNSKTNLVKQRREVVQKGLELESPDSKDLRQIKSVFDNLLKKFEKRSADLDSLDAKLAEQTQQWETLYLERKKRGLTERHHMPRSLDQWQSLLVELTQLPDKMVQIGRNILLSLVAATQQIELFDWLQLLLLSLLWSIACLLLEKLRPALAAIQEHSFTRRALLISTALLHSIRFDLMIAGLLLLTAWMLEIVSPGLAIIAIVSGIWLGARLIIGLSRWILNSDLGIDEKQPGLYRLLASFTVLISLFTLGLALGFLNLVSQPMRELFDRSFMLLLLPPAYLSLRIRNIWYGLLQERKGTTHWVRLAGTVGMFVPLAIASAALLGLFGYINLAWTVGYYLTVILAVVIGWLIARGVVIDLAASIERTIARKSQQSGFWVKSLIEPVQYTIRLLLFLAAVGVLYRIFLDDPATGIDLKAWLSQTLFSFGGNEISMLNLLGALLLLVLVFYLGHWSREITYGWVYAKIKDIGVRNSLSVFTQYAVVVIGLLVMLNVIGINLTSLTVFAGALGVGIGFGMQNIANNFISGLILLAERPVRTSDWVTIGTQEGIVSAIGMRSVTLTTWDNQDVIIPNSDLISNSFTNWTRTDTEVRTVLLVGVSYQADPHLARQVILDAVTMQPQVSLTPRGPQVWLVDFAASSVNFRVQYFTNVAQFSRLEVQSMVLFAIWDALKEAGIGIPFPQQDVYIKELPERIQNASS